MRPGPLPESHQWLTTALSHRDIRDTNLVPGRPPHVEANPAVGDMMLRNGCDARAFNAPGSLFNFHINHYAV